MPTRIVDAELEHDKRELRLRIGRLRRQIDGRIHSTGRKTRRLTSWRTCVRSYPGMAVTAALGFGLALSSGFSKRRLSRWLGLRLIRRSVRRAGELFWSELVQFWADSTPRRKPADNSGADDDRA